MKRLFFISLIFCFSASLFAQEGLDFLDKVNDKPKSTTTKPKEETVTPTTKKQTNVVTTAVTTTGKKKRSKKKSKQNQLVTTETLPQNTNLAANPNTNTTVTDKSFPGLEKQPTVLEEEEVVHNGLWMDSNVSVEPSGLPGFSADLKIGKTEGSKSEVSFSPNKETGKSLFNFSDFFAKYKKAMMILGIIILFAFYRLRSARPGSSSRSYRR
ncbi:Sec region non-globular protein [Leptospira wolbachii serovar Codice str. CDC]|uniref:Sec region non-globular protein n=1 Tax=Leptospira wolbachii serovar Codice str. CDC TaxID=1218599 RepID=R9A587_9LEPT|nr:SRP-less Sec system protein [Leptospira wolbachii]EOQ97378.1 Sec region non-globular protein [Leptospira wolbachii serovar Codice str. CDC]